MAAPIAAPAPSAASYRPAGELDLTTALEPYAGPWGIRQAAHLYRRAGFGGAPDDVARAASAGVHAAVDAFIHFPNTSALPGSPELVADRPNPGQRKMLLAALGPAAQAGAVPAEPDPAVLAARKQLGRARRDNTIAMENWFLDRMIGTPAPLQEKMTLFWHGHFTSAYQKGIPAQALVDQNNLFRANALGNIRELTLKVSQDPAMLRYLDNAQNVKAHPNENYARELMELFTLGIGNYTETDVRESARAFTGWSIDRDYAFHDFPARHDDGSKTFLGQTGNFTGHDIVEIIFTQPAAARLFAKNLLNFFVYNDPEPQLIDAVAALMRKNDFNLQPVMSMLDAQQRVLRRARLPRAGEEPGAVRGRQLPALRHSPVRRGGARRAAADGSDSLLSAQRQGLGRRRRLAQQPNDAHARELRLELDGEDGRCAVDAARDAVDGSGRRLARDHRDDLARRRFLGLDRAAHRLSRRHQRQRARRAVRRERRRAHPRRGLPHDGDARLPTRIRGFS